MLRGSRRARAEEPHAHRQRHCQFHPHVTCIHAHTGSRQTGTNVHSPGQPAAALNLHERRPLACSRTARIVASDSPPGTSQVLRTYQGLGDKHGEKDSGPTPRLLLCNDDYKWRSEHVSAHTPRTGQQPEQRNECVHGRLKKGSRACAQLIEADDKDAHTITLTHTHTHTHTSRLWSFQWACWH